MSETVDFLNLLLVIAIKCNLRQFRKIGQYYNHYYEKFPEAIKLKCGYDLDYIIKYVSCKKMSNCNYKLYYLPCKQHFSNSLFVTYIVSI